LVFDDICHSGGRESCKVIQRTGQLKAVPITRFIRVASKPNKASKNIVVLNSVSHRVAMGLECRAAADKKRIYTRRKLLSTPFYNVERFFTNFNSK
jgi:hypothetical protein